MKFNKEIINEQYRKFGAKNDQDRMQQALKVDQLTHTHQLKLQVRGSW